jgi:hypothetical protein
MYVYIEVFEDSIEWSFYDAGDGKPLHTESFQDWAEVLEYIEDTDVKIHISPDLFSAAGRDNTEWQIQNMKGQAND